MKLKKCFIILIMLILLVSIGGFVCKQNDIEISNILNRVYKNGTKDTFSVDMNGYKCTTDKKINSSNYIFYEMINDNGRNVDIYVLPPESFDLNGIEEDITYAAVYDGCLWEYDELIDRYAKVTGSVIPLCDKFKEGAQEDINMQYIYNSSACVKKYNYKEQYTSFGTETGVLKPNSSLGCNAYYNNYSIDADRMYFSEKINNKWFQILKKGSYKDETTDKNYGDVYLINGCADTLERFLVQYDTANGNLGNICNKISNLIDENNKHQEIENFNNSICVTKQKIPPKSVKYECSIGYSDTFQTPNFLVNGAEWDLESYLTTANCSCENVKPYISSLEQQVIYTKHCGPLTYDDNKACTGPTTLIIGGKKYNYYYLFGRLSSNNCKDWGCDSNYDPARIGKHCALKESTGNLMLNGCAASVQQFLGQCTTYKENVCTNDVKNFLINHLGNFNEKDIEAFNNYCDYLKIKTSKIHLNWQGGDGPETLGVDWKKTNGVYYFTGTVGEELNLAFDKELKYLNYKLKGWSTTADCKNIVVVGGKNPTFKFEEEDKTYYACYSGDIYEGSLFNFDGSKKTGTTLEAIETKECQNNFEGLKNTSMKKNSTYIKSSYDVIKTESVLGKENTYCNVLCVDTVDVNYPNIFETIPAGQYFELMYEPEIKATRTCQSEFRYNDWKNAYTSAINNEKQKMTALNNAQANYEAALNLSTSGTKGTCCSWGTCRGQGCIPPCEEYNYSDSKLETYYKDNLSGKVNGDIQSASGCGASAYTTSRNSTISSAETALKTAKQEYQNAVTERISLEQMNLQCYTILDQDATTLTNESVFKSNYVYKDKYTHEKIVDVNDLSYEIKTPTVNTITANASTKSNYIDYVKTNTGYADDKLQETSIKNIGNTANFFAIYPSLTLKYDDGSAGKPNDLNQEQILDAEAQVKLDTGSYTTVENDVYTKDANQELINGTFYYNGNYGNYISFNAYKATTNKRTVTYYFTYHEAKEYVSELQSGITKEKKGSVLNNYMDLYNKQTVTVGNSNKKKNIYDNVLPVSLKAIGSKDYQIKLELSDKDATSNLQGLTNANYLKLSDFSANGFTGNYTCKYEITNDALVSSDKTSKDYKKLKSNTIFRSVITDKIDPNDRASTGKLGENWTNKKGLAVQDSMQKKETNDSSGSKYTYTDAHLEYSFTLTPTLIKAIQDYNETTNYDDFNLSCATEDGRECVSKFLTNLSEGKVDGANPYSNYSSVNSWGFDDLVKTRKKWKYYNGTEIEEKRAIVNGDGTITKAAMNLDDYLSSYEKWGVLP